jgi:hypothetical protein
LPSMFMDMAPLSHSSTLMVEFAAKAGAALSDANKAAEARNRVRRESDMIKSLVGGGRQDGT